MDLLTGKAQEAIAQVFIGFERPGELGRYGRDILVVNSASGHALVFRIDQNRDTSRR